MADGHGEDSPYFDGWKAYDLNPYDPLLNPSGIIQMGLAENQVGADLIEEWVEKHQQILSWKEGNNTSFKEIALHQDYHGLADFRKALARFMMEVRGGRAEIEPDGIILTAGATAANEILTFCIANPGEALLVPTPYYPGFDRDLKWRTGVELIPVECNSHTNFQITVPALEKAYQQALNNKKTVKALLITNPSNPLGLTIPPQTLHHILDFATHNSFHVISDEVYAGTVFSSPRFTSILEIVQSSKKYNPCTVHVVYSLSKDLGLPGFRVGAIYSQNHGVITTSRRMSSFSLVSSQTQAFLTCLLNDYGFIKRYLRTLRERLRRRHGEFVKGLKDVGIDVLEGNAGLFCWVNLRKLLGRKESWEGEMELWRVILEDIGLNVSPGCSFHCGQAGWFRVCFGNMSGKELDVALGRIRAFISHFLSGSDAGNTTSSDDVLGVAREGSPLVACLARMLDAEQQAESRA
ncbi:1-aminocyclopropane-1-carboxylate synthase 7-like [Magnolia sinica]|uniref:1-aminocyclopropane-1-carboxylate synthase 7-like n=1 Tax=Magnolia sinica TaxID=86752 RepID=UPI002658F330|nr:1-aminocyclopropane-1-carboxylate synthase 7-like [Magnolia sinica]